jgi:hypothetical protein
MSSQEKAIIAKLYAIAQNQQKTIEALVKRAQQSDPNLHYLKNTATTVIFNAGLSGAQPSVQTDQPNGAESTYIVTVSGLTNDAAKQKFHELMNKTIMAQKPELNGKVNINFS